MATNKNTSADNFYYNALDCPKAHFGTITKGGCTGNTLNQLRSSIIKQVQHMFVSDCPNYSFVVDNANVILKCLASGFTFNPNTGIFTVTGNQLNVVPIAIGSPLQSNTGVLSGNIQFTLSDVLNKGGLVAIDSNRQYSAIDPNMAGTVQLEVGSGVLLGQNSSAGATNDMTFYMASTSSTIPPIPPSTVPKVVKGVGFYGFDSTGKAKTIGLLLPP